MKTAIWDFSSCKSFSDIEKKIFSLGEYLINEITIVTSHHEHTILGLEFYIYHETMCPDVHTHKRMEQLLNQHFYVHTGVKKANGPWSPKAFGYCGVDITFGNSDLNFYGGILIRHISGKKNRDGSAVTMRTLLRGENGFLPITRGDKKYSYTILEKDRLKKLNGQSIWNSEAEIYLKESPFKKLKTKWDKRIGLKHLPYCDYLWRMVIE